MKTKKRQKIRLGLLLISLLLFPITIWYFSPYMIIVGAMEGVMTGSFVLFTLLFIGSIVGGRLFCGYLCPMSGLQECTLRIQTKEPRQGFRNLIKYGIWILWMISIVAIFITGKNPLKLDVFYQTDHGISVSNIYAYVIYYGVLLLVLIPALFFGKRIFCHYLCWMAPFMVIGQNIARLLHIPHIHIQSNPDNCISCGKCNQNCPMSVKVREEIKQGFVSSNECIHCGNCIDTCPKNVLHYAFVSKNK